MMHNEATGERCHHCADGTEIDRWLFSTGREARPFSVRYTVHELIACGHLTSAAEAMSAADIVHQYNHVNGGEAWLSLPYEAAPWVARRTAPNSDGSEPALWAFYCFDEADARSWVDCGQADEAEQAKGKARTPWVREADDDEADDEAEAELR